MREGRRLRLSWGKRTGLPRILLGHDRRQVLLRNRPCLLELQVIWLRNERGWLFRDQLELREHLVVLLRPDALRRWLFWVQRISHPLHLCSALLLTLLALNWAKCAANNSYASIGKSTKQTWGGKYFTPNNFFSSFMRICEKVSGRPIQQSQPLEDPN